MAIDRLQTGDDAVRRMQDRIVTALNGVTKCPLLDGVLVEHVALPAGVFSDVGHGLLRAPMGWILTSLSAAAVIWEDVEYTGQDRTRFLRLQASAPVVVNLWVF